MTSDLDIILKSFTFEESEGTQESLTVSIPEVCAIPSFRKINCSVILNAVPHSPFIEERQ